MSIWSETVVDMKYENDDDLSISIGASLLLACRKWPFIGVQGKNLRSVRKKGVNGADKTTGVLQSGEKIIWIYSHSCPIAIHHSQKTGLQRSMTD